MVSNIDIFQGIVSKLEIPVSWQHYCVPINTDTITSNMGTIFSNMLETVAPIK